MAYPAWVAPQPLNFMDNFAPGFQLGAGLANEQNARQGFGQYADWLTGRGTSAQPAIQQPGFLGSMGAGNSYAAPQGQPQAQPQVAAQPNVVSGSHAAAQGATDQNLQGILGSLVQTESGGNWQAQNNVKGAGGARGHFGRLQFGQARLQDAMRAGAIPQGTTPEAFMQSPQLQQAAENWHFADINRQIGSRGLDRYIGQNVGGVPITRDGIIAMAHLGGIGGAARYLESGGQYNPADAYGTSLRDYAQRHGGASGALGAANAMAQGGNPDQPQQRGQSPAMAFAAPGSPPAPAGALPPSEVMQALFRSPETRQMAISLAQTAQQGLQPPQFTQFQREDGSVWQLNTQTGEMNILQQGAAPVGPSARPMTAEERRTWGIPDNDTRPYMIDADGTPKLLGGSGQTINVSTGDAGAGEFWDTLGGAVTGRYTGLIEAGNGAARTLGQLDQLETLLANTPQGFGAAATQFAGNFGIDLGEAEGVQAAAALINQMVPAQRPPGSGPMSDADLELFKQSVPRLINQPGGNQMIIDTMRAINTYDLQAARIVEDYALRGQRAQTPEEADQLRSEMQTALNALQNPLDNFQQRVQPYLREAEDGNAGSAPAPTVGEIVDGYRFKGGDPANPNSWERVE